MNIILASLVADFASTLLSLVTMIYSFAKYMIFHKLHDFS
ncbi:hypothetical protein GAGA_2364 [Paraglaciecola agarilytica NO2]|uniref:GtrA-like protein domain-containing protein n=1 Tax=Paraglaciecola agarilytica NO2 TaxID=1125747 RepID=A0ABQ0I7E2_9ALTE|nr:hypothetical protein GAGA_2364 [Paraglaciecola agarilytica NO2]